MPQQPHRSGAANSTARPATGRSFVIVLIVAALSAAAVTIWTFYSVGKTPRRDGAAAASFKI
jgi:hypothetical protein